MFFNFFLLYLHIETINEFSICHMPSESNHIATSRASWPVRVFRFYRDGFRSMTVGRTLWIIIGIKLFIFFVILRWIFFPDFLSTKGSSDQEKAQYVREQMTGRK